MIFHYNLFCDFFPTIFDIIGYFGIADGAYLLFARRIEHVAFDEFFATAAIIGVIEYVCRETRVGIFVGFPNKELMQHDFFARHFFEYTT